MAWLPRGELPFSGWLAAGRRFGVIGRGNQWWIGDWLHYGKRMFGETYRAAAKVTGYDRQTLMNMVYVSSRFEFSRRRENLSWSHHEAVASLGIADQEYWLDFAETERLSVADMRGELRGKRQECRGARTTPVEVATRLICPSCGEEILLPADDSLSSNPGERAAGCAHARAASAQG